MFCQTSTFTAFAMSTVFTGTCLPEGAQCDYTIDYQCYSNFCMVIDEPIPNCY